MPKRIVVAKPPFGAKCWVADDGPGKYLLEETAGNLLMIVCTHAGSGAIVARDLDGRNLLRLGPAAMGVWNLNAGFHHGLEVEVNAQQGTGSLAASVFPIASIIWQAKPDPNRPHVAMVKMSADAKAGTRSLCQESCILTQVTITSPGSGQIEMLNGEDELLWKMPSMFRGSFNVEHVFAKGGLVQRVTAPTHIEAAIAWLEPEGA